jgi:Flp pilus assembly protein TadG
MDVPLRNLTADLRGSMTVEFVFLVPLLVGALTFGFEFGRALWAYDVVTRDVRAAVRFLSRANPYDASAKTQATTVAKTGTPSGTSMHFPWTNAAAITYSETTFTTANYSVNGTVITATATDPIELSLLSILNSLGSSSVGTNYTLTVTDQARWIGN